MQFNISLKQILFLVFFLFFYNDFLFGNTYLDKEKINFYFRIKQIKHFMFLKKNECFSLLKPNQISSLTKNNITIKNSNFIGVLNKNRFKIFYVVKEKDTLYSIAKNSGHNYSQLSRFNFIKKPYRIIVGEKIWVGDILTDTDQNNCSIVTVKKKNNKKYTSCYSFFKKLLNTNFFLNIKKTTKICFLCTQSSKNKNNDAHVKNIFFSYNWNWPVKNVKIRYIYKSRLRKNKKIEITGFKGEPIFSAAAGEVVCIIDSFKKYGKLIIIRHRKNYLSIYAFNNSILVNLKDRVHEQQKIATMGLSPENHLARLYFEIRYKGKRINPLDVLPKIKV